MRFFAIAFCCCALWSASSYTSSFDFNIIRFLSLLTLSVCCFCLIPIKKQPIDLCASCRQQYSCFTICWPKRSMASKLCSRAFFFVQLLTLKCGFIALVESLTCHLCSRKTWKSIENDRSLFGCFSTFALIHNNTLKSRTHCRYWTLLVPLFMIYFCAHFQ